MPISPNWCQSAPQIFTPCTGRRPQRWLRWRTGGERREANSKASVYLLVRLAAAELSLMALSHRWPKSFCSTITRPSPAITTQIAKAKGSVLQQAGAALCVCVRYSSTLVGAHRRLREEPGSIKEPPAHTPSARFSLCVHQAAAVRHPNSAAANKVAPPRLYAYSAGIICFGCAKMRLLCNANWRLRPEQTWRASRLWFRYWGTRRCA